ncbi:hypothetical protein TDB9533_03187 [Thalassocella blandensis]|nr:hypothetical protein TDB9533_03187 [Thalassocella blandensis]
MKRRSLVAYCFGIVLSTCWASASFAACEKLSVHCAEAINAAYDDQANLHVVFVFKDEVYLTRFLGAQNGQAQFAPYIKVNEQKEAMYTGRENRPKLAFNAMHQQDVYVAWTQKTSGKYNGDIRFTRSIDGGKKFTKPLTVNDDGLITSHRFESLQVDAKGNVYLAWLDKRDKAIALHKAQSYVGSALYFAVSKNRGESFEGNQKIADYACECCRTAIAPAASQGVAIMWRHVYDNNIRDHAFTLVDSQTVNPIIQRVSRDNWKIDGCPHHGPSLASGQPIQTQISPPKAQADKREIYHAVWFTGGKEKQGIFYGRIVSPAAPTEQVTLISERGSHPVIASQNLAFLPSVQTRQAAEVLHIVWMEFSDNATELRHIISRDQGASWSKPVAVMHTQGGSDYPIVVSQESHVSVLWLTEDEGVRVKAL